MLSRAFPPLGPLPARTDSNRKKQSAEEGKSEFDAKREGEGKKKNCIDYTSTFDIWERFSFCSVRRCALTDCRTVVSSLNYIHSNWWIAWPQDERLFNFADTSRTRPERFAMTIR